MARKLKTLRSEALFMMNQLEKIGWLTFQIDANAVRSATPAEVQFLLADIRTIRSWLTDIEFAASTTAEAV